MNRIKKEIKEWGGALLFAVMVATPLRWAIAEPFKVPTSSMEGTILVGDYLLVSKYHYGARTANTILQVPLTFQKIWGTEIPSYLDWIQLPSFRFPGVSEINRNDIVVFNYPDELERPVDMRTYYVKRCVAVAGDTISISNGDLFINNLQEGKMSNMQTSYFIETSGRLNPRVFEKLSLTDYVAVNGGYIVHSNSEQILALDTLPIVKSVQKLSNSDRNVFLDGSTDWTPDNFGPIYVPKQGDTIPINEMTLLRYGRIIEHYDHNTSVSIKEGALYIGGERREVYTFNQDYFFMMGDNRHNSLDSRYWGFVPNDHVVGKPLFTWFSKKKDKLLDIRWERCFKSLD